MGSSAISQRMPSVQVEYDFRGKRTIKDFDDATEAKKFFTTKDREGRNPTVVSGDIGTTEVKEEAGAPKPVKISKGRPFYAGQVLREVGLDAVKENGVTDAMVERVNELTDKPNSPESRYWLKLSFYALAGYHDND